MRKKTMLSAVLLGAAIVSGATAVSAQSAVSTPNDATNQTQPAETPKAPMTTDSMGEHNAVPAASGYDTSPQSSTSVTIEHGGVSAPVAVILEAPKPDGTIIDKLVNHFNNKEVEDIVSTFSKDGFLAVKAKGSIVKDSDELRKELVNIFADPKRHTVTAQVDMVKELAPGVAVIGSYYNMFEEGQTTPKAKMYGLTVVKYEDNAWKIVAQEETDLQASAESEPAKHSGGGMKIAIVTLIGAAIGFFAGRAFPKKPNA